MTIVVAFLVFIIWTVYRLNFPENLLIDELILKPIIWLVPVLIVTKLNINSLGLSTKNLVKNVLIGLAVGLCLSIERIAFNQLSFNFSLLVVISALFTAITEELFFRGYLLNQWLIKSKSPILPMIFNGLFFTLTHVPIAIFVFHYYGLNLFSYLLSNFISGFVDILFGILFQVYLGKIYT